MTKKIPIISPPRTTLQKSTGTFKGDKARVHVQTSHHTSKKTTYQERLLDPDLRKLIDAILSSQLASCFLSAASVPLSPTPTTSPFVGLSV